MLHESHRAVVRAETHAVVAVMRNNTRWSLSARAYRGDLQGDESPLIRGFDDVRRKLNKQGNIPPGMYLSPFLAVIRSPEVSGPITDRALCSVFKFLEYDLVSLCSQDEARAAMADIADAVSNCVFVATDVATDDVVFYRMLSVLLACAQCDTGVLLTDKAVLKLVQTAYRICCSVGLSVLLRRAAEHTIAEVVRTVFGRFVHQGIPPAQLPSGSFTPVRTLLNSTSVPRLLPSGSTTRGITSNASMLPADAGAASTDASATSAAKRDQHGAHDSTDGNGDAEHQGSSSSSGSDSDAADDSSAGAKGGAGEDDDFTVVTQNESVHPHGLPCLKELLRFLCSLVSKKDAPELGDTEAALGVRCLQVALEAMGSSVTNYPELCDLLCDDLMCAVILHACVSDSLAVVQTALQLVLMMYRLLRPRLKLQLEVFFNTVLLRLARSGSVSLEMQERALHTFVDFCHQPDLMPELYLNYDCDVESSNLFESICKFLYNTSFPVSGGLSNIHLLSMEGLLAVVEGIARRSQHLLERTDLSEAERAAAHRNAEQHRAVRQKKKKLMTGAELFNSDIKKGIQYLQSIQVFPEQLHEQHAPTVARFLRETPGLSKTLIGEYIGSAKAFNVAVMHAFIASFDFHDTTFDDAFRMFLEAFRLPGEAQQIGRIMEAFAARYFEHNPHGMFKDADGAFTLAYSLLMLNTDAHSVMVKRKMKLDEFIRNNRGCNGGEDFDRKILCAMYDSITQHPLNIPTDDVSSAMTKDRWLDLMRRGAHTHYTCMDALPCGTTFDLDMFQTLWPPTIASLSVVFERSTDTAVLDDCVRGFDLCAQISAMHQLNAVFAKLVISLCKLTTLLDSPAGDATHLVMLGRDAKALLALRTVFRVTRKWGDHLREAWRNVLDCILRLYRFRVLPHPLMPPLPDVDVDGDGDGDGADTGTATPDTSAAAEPEAASPSTNQPRSVFSALGMYLPFGGSSAASHEPSEAERRAQRRVRETVGACEIPELLGAQLQPESLIYLAKALILASVGGKDSDSASHSRANSLDGSRDRLAAGAAAAADGNGVAAATALTAGSSSSANGVRGDADTSVFCLQLLIDVTLRNTERIMYLWVLVYEHFASIIHAAKQATPLLHCAVTGLMRLALALLHRDEISDQVVAALRLLLTLPPDVTASLSGTVSQHCVLLVQRRNLSSALRNRSAWQTLFDLLKLCAEHDAGIDNGFRAMRHLVLQDNTITSSNLTQCVDTLVAYCRSSRASAERVVNGVGLLYSLHGTVVTLSNSVDASVDVWTELWLPLLSAFASLCRDERRDVRHTAMTMLQSVLGTEAAMSMDPELWVAAFDRVLLPLMTDILERPQHDDETRQRAASMLGKTFLHAMPQPFIFSELWLRVLRILGRYVAVGQRSDAGASMLAELVPEVIKNLVLVVHSHKLLRQDHEDTWQETWRIIETFCQGMQEELFPPEPTAAPIGTDVVVVAAAELPPESAPGSGSDDAVQAAPVASSDAVPVEHTRAAEAVRGVDDAATRGEGAIVGNDEEKTEREVEAEVQDDDDEEGESDAEDVSEEEEEEEEAEAEAEAEDDEDDQEPTSTVEDVASVRANGVSATPVAAAALPSTDTGASSVLTAPPPLPSFALPPMPPMPPMPTVGLAAPAAAMPVAAHTASPRSSGTRSSASNGSMDRTMRTSRSRGTVRMPGGPQRQ